MLAFQIWINLSLTFLQQKKKKFSNIDLLDIFYSITGLPQTVGIKKFTFQLVSNLILTLLYNTASVKIKILTFQIFSIMLLAFLKQWELKN